MLGSADFLHAFELDCATPRFVPKAARTSAGDGIEELLRATLRAERGTLDEVRAWKVLLLQDRLLLWAPRAGRLLRGAWEALLRESRASGEALAARRKEEQVMHKDESYLADAVLRKVLSEEHSRGMALLAGPGLGPLIRVTARLPRAPPTTRLCGACSDSSAWSGATAFLQEGHEASPAPHAQRQ